MLQIEKAFGKVESMIEPDTGIGTEYECFQVHKAGYFETLRIFNPKPQMEVLDVGTMAGHLVLAMKFLGCKVTGTD